MDETFVRIAGHWQYLFRAIDSQGQTVDFYLSETLDREAAKRSLKKALANLDNRPPPGIRSGRARQSRRDPGVARRRFDAPVLSAPHTTAGQSASEVQ
jgi:transposase-like protein